MLPRKHPGRIHVASDDGRLAASVLCSLPPWPNPATWL